MLGKVSRILMSRRKIKEWFAWMPLRRLRYHRHLQMEESLRGLLCRLRLRVRLILLLLLLLPKQLPIWLGWFPCLLCWVLDANAVYDLRHRRRLLPFLPTSRRCLHHPRGWESILVR